MDSDLLGRRPFLDGYRRPIWPAVGIVPASRGRRSGLFDLAAEHGLGKYRRVVNSRRAGNGIVSAAIKVGR